MSWSWRYERSDGNEIPQDGLPAGTFTQQGDAETFIGESWRELLAAGVDQVTLFEGERLVYGPMSLHPAN